MKTDIKCVVFTFPSICGSCEQEELDNESEDIYSDHEMKIIDLYHTGFPLCEICNVELAPESTCEILP